MRAYNRARIKITVRDIEALINIEYIALNFNKIGFYHNGYRILTLAQREATNWKPSILSLQYT